jgi:photosystem II stability/assembly factor-like uncharacterized protein
MHRITRLSIFILLSILLLSPITSGQASPTDKAVMDAVATEEGEWTVFSSPTFNHLFDVLMVSENDGWITGRFGLLLRWDGNTWYTVPKPSVLDQFAIDMVPGSNGNDIWMVGGNPVYRWNGQSWSSHQVPTAKTLYGVSMVTSTEGWIVGREGTIMRWNGNAWQQVNSPTEEDLISVQMLSPNSGWIVGANGTILRWNGTNWSQISTPTNQVLNSISFSSANFGWAVGGNVVLKWNGSNWTQTQVLNSTLRSVHTRSDAVGLMVGGNPPGTSLIYRLSDGGPGQEWVSTPSPTTETLNSVSMASDLLGFAVGQNGRIMRYIVYPPSLSLDHPSGKPGSVFTVTGEHFDKNTQADLIVNGRLLGKVNSDGEGRLVFQLDTSEADEGAYVIRVESSKSTSRRFILDENEPLREPVAIGQSFLVPAGIAFTTTIYLPIISK